jgi:competence protein ComEA
LKKSRIFLACRFFFIFFLFVLSVTACGRDKSYIERKTEGKESYKSSSSKEKKLSDKEPSSSASTDKNSSDNEFIYVDVEGAVQRPGVYSLKRGSRIYEAIGLAGGLNDDASTKSINQAEVLEDGSRIYISTINEYEACSGEDQKDGASSGSDEGIININTASKDELMTLPGIGESKADSIIKYREKQNFNKPSDLMQISGIKEGVFNKIKDRIKV